jgi:hypothetical protein
LRTQGPCGQWEGQPVTRPADLAFNGGRDCGTEEAEPGGLAAFLGAAFADVGGDLADSELLGSGEVARLPRAIAPYMETTWRPWKDPFVLITGATLIAFLLFIIATTRSGVCIRALEPKGAKGLRSPSRTGPSVYAW